MRRLRVARAARVLAHKQLPGAAEEVAYATDHPVVSVRRDRRQRLERCEPYVAFLRDPMRMLGGAALVIEAQEGLVYCKVVLRLQRQQE